MPHPVDPAAHATHDPGIVAAHAAGDLAGRDLAAATALVAGCAACGQLHRDLRAIAAALPELPAPARPRDFRLTAEQAAALRPAGWRGLLATLAGPRFSFAVPLGGSLAALGLAGILLGSLAGLPLGAGGAASATSATGESLMEAPLPAAASPQPSVAADLGAGSVDSEDAAVPTGNGASATAGTAPTDGAVATDGDLAAGAGSNRADDARQVGLEPVPVTGLSGGAMAVFAGAMALLAGLVLVGARWAARRIA